MRSKFSIRRRDNRAVTLGKYKKNYTASMYFVLVIDMVKNIFIV